MKKTIIQPHRSSLGMDANIAVLIMYVAAAAISWLSWVGYLAWAVPLVFFFLEKESKFVKFQAVQALVIGVARAAISAVFGILYWAVTPRDWLSGLANLFGWRGRTGAMVTVWAIDNIIGLAIMALILYVVVMAYGYKQVELPIIGPIASKASEKLSGINIDININQQRENGTEDKAGQDRQDNQK